MKEECASCKKSLANAKGSVKFRCPNCGEAEIVRCGHCREIVAQYECPKCKFVGPN
jgi:hypothetical protein